MSLHSNSNHRPIITTSGHVNYLTINQQVGHKARENHNGQRQVLSASGQAFLKELMIRVLRA